jgi:hypothetical protein
VTKTFFLKFNLFNFLETIRVYKLSFFHYRTDRTTEVAQMQVQELGLFMKHTFTNQLKGRIISSWDYQVAPGNYPIDDSYK